MKSTKSLKSIKSIKSIEAIKCAVFATNSNGEPDIYFCKVDCSEKERDAGSHYDIAKNLAIENGYEPSLCCDQYDPAGAVMKLFNWNSLQ